ncbi:carbon-nitrogen hydrolase [Thelephora terrestris]|uniref:Carbon-nitrogen hydrolase n=1 Tax=Thelephora terrestris TaxID=56493 RepID=A0A9P6H9G1_9AGAM|nr:carbon-nitrogen hydrolase [Thelephora terrestris]
MASSAPTLRAFNLAFVQLGHVGSDKTKNLAHAREQILKAASREDGPKPQLIVLPECFNSPYGATHFPAYAETIGYIPGEPYDIAKSESDTVKMLSSVAKETGTWLFGGTIPEREASTGNLYNTATVYSPQGELVALYRKIHLFDIDIPGKITFKESETLTGGSSPHYFDTEFARVGLGICYDVRFPELTAIGARKGCQVFIYPGASNMTTGPLHWQLLQRARAVDNQVFFGMCSPARDLGAGYHAWGHSLVVDPMGAVLAEAGHEEEIIHVHIDPQVFEDARAGIPVTTQRRFDVYPDVSA